VEWIGNAQQYLSEVLQHLNATPATAWSGFYTSIVFAVLLPLLLYLGKRCCKSRKESQQVGNTFTNSGLGEQNSAQGDNAIGKKIDVNQTAHGNANIIAGTGPVHVVQQINPLPPPSIIPDQRPTPEPCFLHREEEITWLNERLLPGAVVAVCGPGGMGKSALAAQAVSKLEASRFPDGIIFHSFYHQPSTEQALQSICEAFQVEAKTGLESAVRQVLAGKQALLMLDGTEEADDLPAVLRLRGQCGVLITSRKRNDAQGIRRDLKPLDEQPAAEVFRQYSGLAADDPSVAAICKLLGGWPVGLRIAGRYCSSTGESAAAYLRWLEQEPFKELGDGQHQEENAALLLRRSVAAVSEDARQVLGMAGALAFATMSGSPVAAILEDDERRARNTLGELVNYGLLERKEERWQTSHALIHTYARTELPLSTDALKRLAMYYIIFCYIASEEGVQGYARLDGERAHCLRLMESCLASKLWQEVKLLVGAITIYLDRQGWWTEKLTAVEMRLTAARQTGNRKDEGWCLNSLGYTCLKRGEYDKALAWFEQSLPIWRELGDREGEGTTLNNMAGVYRQQGKYELALETLQKSLSIRREIGDRRGEGESLNNIGSLYYAQGDNEQALSYYEQDLAICREGGDTIGEGTTLNNIAEIYRAQGKYSKALEYFEQDLAICRELGDRGLEAQCCWNIGLSYIDMGDLAKAEEYIAQAVQIAEQIGHPLLEKWRDGLARVRAARQG
jgi:tetratricopeptide (TPR) repeat protein